MVPALRATRGIARAEIEFLQCPLIWTLELGWCFEHSVSEGLADPRTHKVGVARNLVFF